MCRRSTRRRRISPSRLWSRWPRPQPILGEPAARTVAGVAGRSVHMPARLGRPCSPERPVRGGRRLRAHRGADRLGRRWSVSARGGGGGARRDSGGTHAAHPAATSRGRSGGEAGTGSHPQPQLLLAVRAAPEVHCRPARQVALHRPQGRHEGVVLPVEGCRAAARGNRGVPSATAKTPCI